MTSVGHTRSRITIRVVAAFCVVTAFCLAIPAQGLSTTNKIAGPDTYDSLVNKLKAGDTNIDYRALRNAYAARKDADGAGSDHLVRRTMNVALTEKRFQDTIKIGEGILATVYISPDTHAALSRAYAELGDAKKAKQHKAVYLGLINSILAEGNGQTFETAYRVVTIEEAFAVMRALGLSVWGQTMGTRSGHWYEMISATDQKTGTIVKIHFNIDTARAIQARSESPKP